MLIVNGEPLARPATEEDIMTAIPELGVDEFVVVERAEQEYLQVLSRTDDWLIEEREGGDDKHFQAIMAKGAPGDLENYAAAERRVIRVVADYLCGGSRDQTLSWKQIYK